MFDWIDTKVVVIVIMVALDIIVGLTLFYFMVKNDRKREARNAEQAGEEKLKKSEKEGKLAQSQKGATELQIELDIMRAKGTAEVAKIIGEAVKGNEGYLKWCLIHQLNDTKNKVVYIPTEAGIPVIELGASKE
jgi:hypothetical protein